MSFRDVIGQEKAVAELSRMLETGRVPHALLFAGPAGVGRSLAAYELAKALLCPKAKPFACDKCPSCHRVDTRTHADLIVQGLPEGKATIGIDPIRDELAPAVYKSPLEGKRKVAIVDPADMLTEEAQNALLKTLEEPPADTTIVLVAENLDALLATVRSRCRRVSFVPLASALVEKALVARGASKAQAEAAAKSAEGSIARALELVEGDGTAERDAVVKAILAAGPGDEPAVVEQIVAGGAKGKKAAAREKRETTIWVLTGLHAAIVDAMRLKAGAPVRGGARMARSVEAFAGEAEGETLAALEKEVSDAIIVLGANADAQLAASRIAAAFARRDSRARNTG